MRALVVLSILGAAGCASAAPLPVRAPDFAHCAVDPAPSDVHTIDAFYDAFAHRDFQGMACSYTPDVTFTDPMFGTLHGKRAFAMWAMLISEGADVRVQHSGVHAEGPEMRAHWDAQYTFPFLGFHNAVANSIDASFEMKGGKIFRHEDHFDIEKWMHAALWPMGGVVSESTIRSRVKAKLDDFIAEHREFQD